MRSEGSEFSYVSESRQSPPFWLHDSQNDGIFSQTKNFDGGIIRLLIALLV